MFHVETARTVLSHGVFAFSALPPAIDAGGGSEEGIELWGEPHSFEIWSGGFCRAQIQTVWRPCGLREDTVLAGGASAGRALTRSKYGRISGCGETPEFKRFARDQNARAERRAGKDEIRRELRKL